CGRALARLLGPPPPLADVLRALGLGERERRHGYARGRRGLPVASGTGVAALRRRGPGRRRGQEPGPRQDETPHAQGSATVTGGRSEVSTSGPFGLSWW